MKQNKKSDKKLLTQQLENIRMEVESLIERNRSRTGSGRTISEIEQDLFSGILKLGKLLLEDRIIEEDSDLEDTGYSITGKEDKESGSSKS